MSLLAATTYPEVEALGAGLASGLRSMHSLESAGQWFVRDLAQRFPSIVLARVFGTVPRAKLPQPERAAADAGSAGLALLPSTEVLTLFASAGARPEWNDRRRSQGHLAIPLVSRAHVDDIPMVSRLFGDLRFRLANDAESSPFVTRAFANANGLFYVPDAATTVDEKGRKVIPASDFIREQSVQSVFGFGGSYVTNSMFVCTIIFTQEHLIKNAAMNFLQLSSAFKAGTTRFVNRGLLFESQEIAWSNG